jgi:hypothetical protein
LENTPSAEGTATFSNRKYYYRKYFYPQIFIFFSLGDDGIRIFYQVNFLPS